MNKKVLQKKDSNLSPLAILEGKTFLTLKRKKHDVNQISVEEFDAWADSLCGVITGVKRDVWDVFARWDFLEYLVDNCILTVTTEADGVILLTETEEKTSEVSTETEEKTLIPVAIVEEKTSTEKLTGTPVESKTEEKTSAPPVQTEEKSSPVTAASK